MPRFYDFGANNGNSVFCRINSSFKYGAGEKLGGGTTLMVEAASATQPLNETVTVAVTFDAATKTTTIYANGKQVAQGTKVTYEAWQAAPNGNDGRNYIGRTQWWDNNSDNGDVVGTLDNFRLYDIALTAEEIANVTSDIKACTKPLTDSCALYSINGIRLETEPSRGMFIKSGKKMIK